MSTHPLLISTGAGATNHQRLQGQRKARQLLESDAYQEWCQERINLKSLPPAVEIMLWQYAYGKPKETIDVNVSRNDFSSMSLSELQEKARMLSSAIDEANKLSSEISTIEAEVLSVQ